VHAGSSRRACSSRCRPPISRKKTKNNQKENKRVMTSSRGLLLLCVLAAALLGAGVVEADAGHGYEPGLDDEGDWADEMGYQSDPAYEQYAERLQQQLESLRKEHDEIFGRADVDKVCAPVSRACVSSRAPLRPCPRPCPRPTCAPPPCAPPPRAVLALTAGLASAGRSDERERVLCYAPRGRAGRRQEQI